MSNFYLVKWSINSQAYLGQRRVFLDEFNSLEDFQTFVGQKKQEKEGFRLDRVRVCQVIEEILVR